MIKRALVASLLSLGTATAGASLPLASVRHISFETAEGTWMAPDVSPDGKSIVFDLLGDLYSIGSAGGQARPLMTGAAFDANPVFSPDGRQLAFISDRSGANNLWVADADGSHPRQISQDDGAVMWTGPSWSPDGQYIYASRMVHATLAFEVFMFNKDGGLGTQVTKAKPSGTEDWESRRNVLGAVVSPDGRYLYFSSKAGTTWTEKEPPQWSITRRDLRNGKDEEIIQSLGEALQPAISHDGRKLVYASRHLNDTGLRIRDLSSGDDQWLLYPVDRDGHDGGYYANLLPRYAFTSDDRALILSVGGKIKRLELADRELTDIPFTAQVELDIGPQTRVEQHEETGPVRVRVIQRPRQSPDGRSIVFSALGQLYLLDLQANAKPRALGAGYQPSWSYDGRAITFVTWNAHEGGQVWTVPARGPGAPKQLTEEPAYYTEPVFSPDGKSVLALRASHYDRLRARSEIDPSRATDIIRLPAGGGDAQLIAHAYGARFLDFGSEPDLIRFFTPEGVKTLRIDEPSSEPRRVVVVLARHPSQYVEGPAPVEEVRLNPDGTRALAKAASRLYLVAVPPRMGDEPPVVNLQSPSTKVVKLTAVGADYFGWADEGRTITWSVGPSFRRVPLSNVTDAEKSAERFDAVVELKRDVPEGAVVLRGATVITMRGDEVLSNADVVVVNNKIVGVGGQGSVQVPAGAVVRDVSGKFIVPGFVDTHAHWAEIRRDILEPNQWPFLANLAYGVTSGLDVQPFTVDAFGYQDMIDAGLMLGPRAYSTGPGVFVNSEIRSEADARNVLTRYRDYYRTRNIKSYMVGGRKERQFMIQGASALGMMPTTEGASDLRLNLTHALDGFAGNEHALPISPLHKDVIELFAKSRIAYTPTISVLYGGKPALFEMTISHVPQADAKVQRFIPGGLLDVKTRVQKWMRHEDQTYSTFAADALAIQRAGGLVGMGSHGEMQGIGYHWELEAYASGGATPHEVLRAATIGSSEVIGRAAELGSIEAGKYADLLILDRDPLNNIANTNSLSFVMKNGRLYDANTLDEVWPLQKKLEAQWFSTDAP
ncbi:amidohydrolase family protein [Peristeroidobacter agariperforans]|uniref:amidohydrolase family protein n=1 Tax=Peristeroidobacter agariperforans TaxID=268404 RepID=UPI0018E501F3|nr:amidohydrolase family protein [Peristeroidobacter agariperforans]